VGLGGFGERGLLTFSDNEMSCLPRFSREFWMDSSLSLGGFIFSLWEFFCLARSSQCLYGEHDRRLTRASQAEWVGDIVEGKKNLQVEKDRERHRQTGQGFLNSPSTHTHATQCNFPLFSVSSSEISNPMWGKRERKIPGLDPSAVESSPYNTTYGALGVIEPRLDLGTFSVLD
jgi:hypothetical protein